MTASSHEALLARECEVFTRFLIGRPPSEYVVRRYVIGHRAEALAATGDRLDDAILQFARRSPFATRVCDAYASVLGRRSRLRCKLVLLLAVLETAPQIHRELERAPAGVAPTLVMLVGRGIAAIGLLALGAVVVVGARLTLGFAAARSRLGR